MLRAKNDNPRLIKEFIKLRTENRHLAALLIDLYHYVDQIFEKDTIMTMIYRTQDEQDRIYAHSARYRQNPWKSPHQFWQAVDIRSFIFTTEEILHLVDYLNNKYNSSNYYKWTAKYHQVGNGGYHFHIQYYKVR